MLTVSRFFSSLLLSFSILLTGGCGHHDKPIIPSSTTPATDSVAVEFETLKGKWNRMDGGYQLEFKKLVDKNTLEVAYYNPNPIHVGKARLYKENGFTKVFVELQDVNYPGSAYTLIYDAQNKLLRGTYYQATQQVEFQVEFQREQP